jgi:hypothetical protein
MLTYSSFAQKKGDKSPTWFFLSGGGGFGNAMFFEKHFFEGVEVKASALNPTYGFYGKFGVMFPFNMGLVYEFSSQTLTQSYDMVSNNPTTLSEEYTDKIVLGTTGHAILLRAGGVETGYFEIGPKFTTNSKTPDYRGGNMYAERYTTIELGFGGPLYYQEAFDISLGVRLNYALTNIMQDEHYPYAGPLYSTSAYTDLYTTNPLTLQLRLEFHWRIGYFKTAKCDGHTEFLFFGKN